MQSLSERYAALFRRWEVRGRGWQVHPHPVAPEPPFVPFRGHVLDDTAVADDGRRPTALSSFFASLWGSPPVSPPEPEEEEPEARKLERRDVVELPLSLPADFDPKAEQSLACFRSLALCAGPLAFELVGTPESVTAQIAAGATDQAQVRQQLRAFFPDVVCVPGADRLGDAWQGSGNEVAAVDFGLGEACMLPLAEVEHDLAVPLVGALSDLRASEMAVFQVLFQPARRPWAESMRRAVTDDYGEPFFVDAPELVDGAKAKTASPLYAVVVRAMACAAEYERAWEILRSVASPLRALSAPGGNELIPLRNDGYPLERHTDDILRRQTHRSGMLLGLDELAPLIRLPGKGVVSARFRRQIATSKDAPTSVSSLGGLILGTNEHAGEKRLVRLSQEQRTRHVHVIGASGTGKSTLLFNLLRQDIANGEGVGLIDPHGDLIDRVLGAIPRERIDDVVLIDPADDEHVVGFNILSAHTEWEKSLLASDLVSVFRRLSTSWGDQMGNVLQNAILAFLESSRGGTLVDLRRFLLEPAFREEVLQTVTDPDVAYYWRKGFPALGGNKSIGPVLTRLETFLAPKAIRYMVGQRENRINFPDILDSGKIFLARLSQGLIGRENAQLLGSLFVAKIHQTALGRQRLAESSRKPFWFYIDECGDFLTASIAEILSGARKYRLGLTLAHQELRQLERDPDVASATLANAYTRIAFRLGDDDADALENGFASFESSDLQNLATGEAICRIERRDHDFNLRVAPPAYPSDEAAALRRKEISDASRARYATPRAAIEALLRSSLPATATPAEQPPAPPIAEIQSPVPPPTPPPPVRPAVSESAKPAAPEPGRGGAQHKAIQKRIRDHASALGFRVTLEKSILDGRGSIDALLDRDGLSLPCEITVTTTIDHEVGNVTKCLEAGFANVAVVSVTEEKLAKISAAVSTSLGAKSAALVSYFLPDAFLAHLDALPRAKAPDPIERKVRGYKVKTTFRDIPSHEAKAREDAMIKIVGDTIRGRRRA